MTLREFTTFLVILFAVYPAGGAPEPGAMIQAVGLNAARPYFVPTHPRVTTTIRFPKEIGAPDGSISVFTEDAAKQPGEYLVTWQQGDPYFTITPLKDARMANLNVPFDGQTYVFFFYPVGDPLKASAVVNVGGATKIGVAGALGASSAESPEPPEAVMRQRTPPATSFMPLTPSRLVGFLDRLKLIHATPAGPALAAMAKAMHVQVAIGRDELGAVGPEVNDPSLAEENIGELGRSINACGLYEVILLRAVRDRRLNCVGFICLIHNTSNQTLVFDVNSFGARAGAEYLSQRISDAKPTLAPSEQAPAYFAILPDRNTPLLATNDWRISVDLVSPRLNPGASIAGGFGAPDAKP